MANLSDGGGTVIVEKVAQELKDFLNVVQKDAYYELFNDVEAIEPDNNGNAEFSFGASGRWNYESNLRGYLEGEWMNGEEEKKAYNKLMRAIKKKDGLISVEYTDSDPAMDWMGRGEYNVSVCDGELVFNHSFEEERITLRGFADLNGDDLEWALGYLYGYDVEEAYSDYVKEQEKKGEVAVEPDVWYDTIYEAEEV